MAQMGSKEFCMWAEVEELKIGLDCMLNGPSPTCSVTHAVRVSCVELIPGFDLLTLFVEVWWVAFGTFLNPEINSILLEIGAIIGEHHLKS
uniref:Uncharacterized protein n=1 Tax=Lactuca sativa TaxID=4236 RepID=A0A9R1XIB3_LACSA|nr:hypothetical protein LSAT_V11C400162420 [Lactuca sativa]